MPDHQNKFTRLLHRAAVSAENAVDEGRRRVWRARGRNQAMHLAAYRGHADDTTVHVTGRVLANKPSGGPLDDDGWWENLLNTWKRWESDEVAGAAVRIRFLGQEQTILSDEEGYYHAAFASDFPASDELRWLNAEALTISREGEIVADHPIMVPPRSAGFGIISDLDDTVLHTGITSLLLAAKLTFLENAKTRKPLEGVAELYKALQHGSARTPVNPLFYISSSPWNLYDLLGDFLRLNDVPSGPVMLRDLGLDDTKFIKEKGHGHKLDKALGILDGYPGLPFVLIGDSGQEDPAIYADLVRQRPGRILAIYIRDVNPDIESTQDEGTRLAARDASLSGVPMILAPDSLAISAHAMQLGLIAPAAVGDVASEVKADRERPEAGAEAVRQAVESVFEAEG